MQKINIPFFCNVTIYYYNIPIFENRVFHIFAEYLQKNIAKIFKLYVLKIFIKNITKIFKLYVLEIFIINI